MKGILLGRIINTNGCEVFVEGGGIPKQNVLRIEGEKEEYLKRKNVNSCDKRGREDMSKDDSEQYYD